MAVLTEQQADRLDRDAARLPATELAGYLQAQLGQRIAAHVVGLSDTRQLGRLARGEHPPRDSTDRRLRAGYKVTRMLADAYDATTAKAWLFGTNTRLDDHAPVDILSQATDGESFTAVVRAARQFASVDG